MAKKKSRPRVLVLGGGLAEQLAKAGAESVYMPYADPKAVEAAGHENIHALVLTGGSDVDPKLYGAKRDKNTQSPYTKRDEVEVRALNAAFKRGIPIFGICRGSQMINVAFGGTLIQHIPNAGAHRWHLGHDHRVDLMKGSRIAKAMKQLQPWVVSIHHQAVDKVAPGFRVTAKAMDGIAEAIESTSKDLPWIVATQFHPEIQTSKHEQNLFSAMVIEAAKVAGLPKPVPFELPKVVYKPKPVNAGIVVRQERVDIPGLTVPVTTRTILPAGFTGELHGPNGPEWVCFRCAVEFDFRSDHVDHMYEMHDIDLVPLMTEQDLDDYIDDVARTNDELISIEERWLAGV